MAVAPSGPFDVLVLLAIGSFSYFNHWQTWRECQTIVYILALSSVVSLCLPTKPFIQYHFNRQWMNQAQNIFLTHRRGMGWIWWNNQKTGDVVPTRAQYGLETSDMQLDFSSGVSRHDVFFQITNEISHIFCSIDQRSKYQLNLQGF